MSNLCWIAHERYSENASVNLICFSYVGGSATYFAPLKTKIDSRINICPVLYPGREKNIGKKGFDTVREMAQAFARENKYLFERRFALLGHCTGALIAYEVAVAVQELYNVSPDAFIASSSPAPSCKQFWPKNELLDDELTMYLLNNHMVDLDFTKNEIYTTYYLPLIRSDLQMFTRYTPSAPYARIKTSVNVLRGDSDMLFDNPDAVSAWKYFTEGGVTEDVFTGGHFYIDQHRGEVGEYITKKLI